MHQHTDLAADPCVRETILQHEKAELEVLRSQCSALRSLLAPYCSADSIVTAVGLQPSRVGTEAKQVAGRIADRLASIVKLHVPLKAG